MHFSSTGTIHFYYSLHFRSPLGVLIIGLKSSLPTASGSPQTFAFLVSCFPWDFPVPCFIVWIGSFFPDPLPFPSLSPGPSSLPRGCCSCSFNPACALSACAPATSGPQATIASEPRWGIPRGSSLTPSPPGQVLLQGTHDITVPLTSVLPPW